MERLRETPNLIAVFLLAIGNLAALSSCQNLNTTFVTSTIDTGFTVDDVDQHVNYSWSQPSNTTVSISQETTTYSPAPTTDQAQEILDSAETGFPSRYRKSSRRDDEEDDEPDEPADHVIPYSVHEDARDVSTRPEYVAPGLWAKPPPDKDIPLDFVPTKLHAQVRGTHTVKRLPQREAIESAETDEERDNAHRLREVVTNSKVNTVYTEEGYEDSAYDHAGRIRDADFHEGFARKLHDRKNDKQNSRSGKRKKGEHMKLVPDEYKEYNQDYQDHVEESRERDETSDNEHNLIGYGKNAWEGSEIDPKLVVANGVQELDEDIEEDAEEAERSEKVYQRQQESKPPDEDDDDNSESEETRDDDDLKNEENKSVTSKKQKSKLWKEKTDALGKGMKTLRKSAQKKKLREESHETTVLPVEDGRSSEVDPETPASPHGFVTNPLNLEVHSIDQTPLKYVTPVPPAAFQQLDKSTINYSQLLWDYIKANQVSTIRPIAFISDSTTPQPRLEEHTPVAVATIDYHSPYLLVTKEETSTLPSTFLGTSSFHPQSLYSDNVDFGSIPVEEQGQGHHLPGSNDQTSYLGDVDNVIATSTVAPFSSVQPLLLQPLQTTNIENAEYSSSPTLLDDVASTPAIMTLNFTEEAYSQIDDYQENPFLGPVLDNSNVAVARNKLKYRVLMRPTPKQAVKPTTSPQPPYQYTFSSTLQEEDASKKIHEELNAKYTKILDYIKGKQKIKPLVRTKKIILPVDFSLLKPPVPHQRAVHLGFPASRPFAKHSAVSVESESSREANSWRGTSQDQHRSQPIDPSYRPLVLAAHPARLTYRKNLLPVTELLPPPPPLPLPPLIAGTHVAYHSGSQHNDYLSHVLGRPQQQQPRDNTLKLFPLTPDASWRPRRKKRSGDDTTSEISLVIGGSDENAEESAKKKRHVSQGERRSRGNSRKSLVNDEDHERLLNKSPKISGDVIDAEIATRFNETSTENKDEGEVEAEVPTFDYVEELAEDSTVEPSTTTETHIDTKKYPFYNNENVPVTSALKYVVDPRTIPRKTSRGMAFYDSRNAYKQCDEVEDGPDKVLPEKEEPDPERGPPENLPRLRGLGDKLDCFKAKYFDENPLDNPLFAEKSVEEPKPPAELDPVKFASKVLLLPEEDDNYVVHQVSKKPERHGRQWRRRNPQYEKHKSIRVNYKHDPKTGRGRNAYLYMVRGSRLPSTAVHRIKNREPKPKSPTSTPSPKTERQTESYQNQVYEDVMGNIRNMAKGYEVYEITTLPATSQIQTAGSENTPKVAEDTPNLSTEKNTTGVANVTSDNAMSSEIKGLVPPPKHSTPRRLTNYRKYRPLGKNRISVLRAPSLPRIIAHHHTIKISKRSATAMNASEDTSDKDEKKTVGKPMEVVAVNGNDMVNKTTTMTTTIETSTNSTPVTLDLEIEESRLVRSQKQRPLSSTLKVDDKRRRRNSTSGDPKNEATTQRIVYTIRDRIRYSKPKWNTEGFGKFSASPKAEDVDSRRKEPRYNHLTGKKPVADSQDNSTALSAIDSNILAIESATSPTGGRESGTTETRRPQDSVAHQSVYSRKVEYPEAEATESVNDAKSEESSEEEEEDDDDEEDEDEVKKEEGQEEEEKEKEETEKTTNTYRVHEDVNEDVPATTTKLPSPVDSKELLNFEKYFETDPPGYAETFPEEMGPSNKNFANTKNKPKDSDEKQDQDHSKSIADSLEDGSSEKTEERAEMPMKTRKGKEKDDDSSEESSSKEEEGSKDDQTFFTYTTQPSWVEKDNKPFEKTLYRPFPFTRYKSMIKKEQSYEDEEPEEESEEVNEDYVFPWQSDKESDKSRKLKAVDRYEYPWERRERLANDRRKRRQRERRFKKLILDDEDEDEDEEEEKKESRRREKPLYPWEKYKVPSKGHTKRNVSRRNTDDSEEELNSEELTIKKFSSRYNADVGPTARPSSARQIGRSIKKFLEDDFDESEEETSKGETSKEETSMEETSKEVKDHSASPTQMWPATSRGISRGTLVPEDVTQPPRRKSGRRRTSHYDKDLTSNLRFDSAKKLKSEVTNDEEGEEKEGLMKDYLKLSKSKSEKSGPQAEAASSQLFNITKEASSSTSAPRKKRRRIVHKNNSTISLDNAPAESSTVSSIVSSTEATKRKRRKPRVSTTTSSTPPASDDLKTSKSEFAHLRRRYSTAGDIARTNRPNSTEEIPSSTVGTVKADSAQAETSTPKTRTIEHRSRVSKEKIVTRTMYPGESFDVARRNATFALQEPLKKLRIRVSRRKSNGKGGNGSGSSHVNERPIKRKDQGEYHDTRLKEDDVGRSEKPERDGNHLKDLGMRKEEVKKINNFSTFDGIINDEDNDFGNAVPSEVSSSPHHRTVQLTQHSSRQSTSSMSWVSNNYDH